jgi:hypothetical protein
MHSTKFVNPSGLETTALIASLEVIAFAIDSYIVNAIIGHFGIVLLITEVF